ncbi:hypothetical protein R1sor_024626 [Riccia sorocarpa]|uniref:Uncharacterized protein n=1 Tax=Riccia sorocarpa TaxID=122646 RepID=A0ABD3GU92_9MARC
MANRDLNLPWYTEEYRFDADAQPPFPGSAELDAGSGDQGPDETQNSPARSDADNSPESEEEPVLIPENGLPGWIAVGPSCLEAELEEVDASRKPQLEWKTHASSKMFCVLLRLGAPWYQDRLVHGKR